MKIAFVPHSRASEARRGLVLTTVLVLTLTACFVVAALSSHSVRSILLARRSVAQERAFISAESGLGYAIMAVRAQATVAATLDDLKDACNNDLFTATGDFPVCPEAGFQYCKNRHGAAAADVTATGEGGYLTITIKCGAYDEETGTSCALMERVAVEGSSICDYLAFFEGDLEFDPASRMEMLGKIHCNSDIYVGGDLYLWDNVTAVGGFYNLRKDLGAPWYNWTKGGGTPGVWVRYGADSDYDGVINWAKGNGWGQTKKNVRELSADGFLLTWDETFDWHSWKKAWGNGKNKPDFYGTNEDTPGAFIDSNLGDEWLTAAVENYGGRILTGEHGIKPIKFALGSEDDNHTLIERPLLKPGIFSKDWKGDALPANISYETETAKFANKAALTIYVQSDGSLRAYDANGRNISSLFSRATVTGKSSDGIYSVGAANSSDTSATHEFQTNNRFFDQREQMFMAPVDIYVDQLLANPSIKNYLYSAGDAGDAGLVYITRDQPPPCIITSDKVIATKSGSFKIPNKDPNNYYHITGKLADGSSVDTYTANSGEVSNFLAAGLTCDETTVPGSNLKNVNCATYTFTRVSSTPTGDVVPYMPCVRIRNGADLTNAGTVGLSIVSDLPVYTEGSFNTDGEVSASSEKKNNGNGNKKNTAATAGGGITIGANNEQRLNHPAMIAGDAITVLSGAWDDAAVQPVLSNTQGKNWKPYQWAHLFRQENWPDLWRQQMEGVLPEGRWGTQHTATKTTINGILMTGTVPTAGDFYSGGLQNIFRYMEDWGYQKNKNKLTGINNDINGSIICLWDSELACNQVPDIYDPKYPDTDWRLNIFTEPMRHWQYARTNPPGMPGSLSAKEYEWRRIRWTPDGGYDESSVEE